MSAIEPPENPIRPLARGNEPAMHLSVVVLQAPLLPRMVIISPGSIVNERPLTTSSSLYATRRSSTSSSGMGRPQIGGDHALVALNGGRRSIGDDSAIVEHGY